MTISCVLSLFVYILSADLSVAKESDSNSTQLENDPAEGQNQTANSPDSANNDNKPRKHPYEQFGFGGWTIVRSPVMELPSTCKNLTKEENARSTCTVELEADMNAYKVQKECVREYWMEKSVEIEMYPEFVVLDDARYEQCSEEADNGANESDAGNNRTKLCFRSEPMFIRCKPFFPDTNTNSEDEENESDVSN